MFKSRACVLVSSPILISHLISSPPLLTTYFGLASGVLSCSRHVRGYCPRAVPGPRGRPRAHGGAGRGPGGDAQAQEGVRRRDHRGAAGGLRGGAPGRQARLVVPGLVMSHDCVDGNDMVNVLSLVLL